MPQSNATGTILVTGANGHLGANLVRRLIGDDETVRVLLQASDDNVAVDGLDVEQVYGDIRNVEEISAAVEGCTHIYHAAVMVSTIDGNARHKREIFDSNVIGTRNLLQAARGSGVQRVVVSGSFSALGYDLNDPTRPVDETSLMYPFGRAMPYSRTKVLVEQECLRAAAHGLPVMMATSTGILGPYDYRPSRLGRTLCDYANGKLKHIIPGGHEFVAARDIVEGHVLAMNKGRPGQNYLFSTVFLSLDELLTLFREFAGPQPRYHMGSPTLMLPVAEVLSFTLSRLVPKFEQRFTPGAIRRLSQPLRANITKAVTELGYAPTDIHDTLREVYDFHCARGTIRRPQPESTATAEDKERLAAPQPEPRKG